MPSRDKRGEQGAIAIFVSLVLLAVCFPLAGLGYSAYVRGATAAELQRAADSGALAGASAIPLADLSAVNSYLANVGISVPLLPTSPPADPRVIACKQAVRAAQVDDGFSEHYATPTPDGTASPACAAEYTPDLSVLGGITSCVNSVLAYDVPLVGGLLGLPLGPILGVVRSVINDLLDQLGAVAPALLQPGVKVTLTWNVRGPLDALNPADDGTAKVQTVSATARRRFKNLVVLPTTTLPGAGAPIPLNAAVSAVGDELVDTLFALNSITGDLLVSLGFPGCSNLIGALATDIEDLVNPPPDAEAPTVEQVLQAAVADAEPVLLLMVPLNAVQALSIPFIDFVPVCIQQAGGSFEAVISNLPTASGCLANAPGAFRGTLVK